MQGDYLRQSYRQSGTFGFTHLMDLSPAEVMFFGQWFFSRTATFFHNEMGPAISR